jgi:hypothetical protein
LIVSGRWEIGITGMIRRSGCVFIVGSTRMGTFRFCAGRATRRREHRRVTWSRVGRGRMNRFDAGMNDGGDGHKRAREGAKRFGIGLVLADLPNFDNVPQKGPVCGGTDGVEGFQRGVQLYEGWPGGGVTSHELRSGAGAENIDGQEGGRPPEPGEAASFGLPGLRCGAGGLGRVVHERRVTR